jgi:hypothetical protein
VEVPSDGLIADLKVRIKEKNSNGLARVDACNLEVWRLRNPRGSREIKQNLPNLRRFDQVLFEDEEEAARLVLADQDILSHFSGLPRNKISVLVRVSVPPFQIGGSSDNLNRECSIRLLTPAYRVWRTRCPTMQMTVVSAQNVSNCMKLCSSKCTSCEPSSTPTSH